MIFPPLSLPLQALYRKKNAILPRLGQGAERQHCRTERLGESGAHRRGTGIDADADGADGPTVVSSPLAVANRQLTARLLEDDGHSPPRLQQLEYGAEHCHHSRGSKQELVRFR